MPLTLYNTYTRRKESFVPLSPSVVGLYTCGPTVYNYLHVGNYRTYVFEDILKRALKSLGYPLRHVMNITDVGHLTSQADEGEDKVELEAAKAGKSAKEISEFYTRTFLEDVQALNIDFSPSKDPAILNSSNIPGDILCLATQHIPEQIDLIRTLESKGMTYRTSDGIYYDTGKFPSYGQLMGRSNLEGLRAGARVEANPEKKNPTDFALWKFSPKDKKRQMEWESPWGRGFPGWHIECSAMAMRYLGASFDIHCGGVDHIPIHHTNEIAQSEAATGKPFVRFWLHGEFLLMNNAKMAKSAGGFIRLQDLVSRGYDALDFRYLCLTAHYRKQLDFSWEALSAARSALQRLKDKTQALKESVPEESSRTLENFQNQFRECVSNDLDMPGALATLWDALKPSSLPPQSQAAFIRAADAVLGLRLLDAKSEPPSAEASDLLFQRQEARKAKDFAASDRIRKQLLDLGIVVEDTAGGQRWKRNHEKIQ